jgi:3-oxoacyl-[acyl-carrier-protein] synthase II
MPPSPESFRVAVTAMGVISPLGIGVAETLRSLRAGRDCVTPVEEFDVSRCRSKAAGQIHRVPGCCTAGKHELHRASYMMISAAQEALTRDPAFRPELMVIGTTSGGMSFGQDYYRQQMAKSRKPGRARLLANYLPQKPVLDVQAACGLEIPSQIIANACASGTNAIGHSFELIRTGRHSRILCGGYDAISELVYVGFDSLQASTPEKIRPFDGARSGLVLGEGAALLALERMDLARERGARVLAEVTGYGISTDNHHLTQPHPSGVGPRLAMERALTSAGCRAEEVDYINAHGTATTFNDATEGVAIQQIFGSRKPVSSTKSMMGHALGAAGAIEAVISIIAIQQQFLPPNINYQTADPAWSLNVVANEAQDAAVRCVISNSFGFGGTNASVVLQQV